MNLYWKTKVTLSSLFLLGFIINPVNKPIDEVNKSLKESDSENKKEYIKSLYSKASFTASNLSFNNTSNFNGNTTFNYTENLNNNTFNSSPSNEQSTYLLESIFLLSLLFGFLFLKKEKFLENIFFKNLNKLNKFWNYQIFQSTLKKIESSYNLLLFQNKIFQQDQFRFFTQVKHYSCA